MAAQELIPRDDLAGQAGLVFAALADTPSPAVTLHRPAEIAAVRRAMAPFRRAFHLGGMTVVMNRTGLTDLAQAWGPAVAHRHGELAYSVACWAEGGRQVALASALDAGAPYAVNGWALSQEAPTPPGCSEAPPLSGLEAVPGGLRFGATASQVARRLRVTPTTRRAGVMEWQCDLPAGAPGAGWTETILLRCLFRNGRLVAVASSSVTTN